MSKHCELEASEEESSLENKCIQNSLHFFLLHIVFVEKGWGFFLSEFYLD